LREVSFEEALVIVFRELQSLFSYYDELLSMSVRQFFLALPHIFKGLLGVPICES
jgi:hypothetical protein